jgi:hypothetical protein
LVETDPLPHLGCNRDRRVGLGRELEVFGQPGWE